MPHTQAHTNAECMCGKKLCKFYYEKLLSVSLCVIFYLTIECQQEKKKKERNEEK